MSLGSAAGDGGFGSLLRRYRLASGLTQEELAAQSGLSVHAIANMERGRTSRPYRRSVWLLADALELDGPQRELLARAARSGAIVPPGTLSQARAGRAVTGTRPPTGVPHQLPARVPHFAGRAAELETLNRLLEATTNADRTVAILAIAGTAGVGKTALALHWAHRVASCFPDGQLHANLRGFGPDAAQATSAEVVRLFLDGLGVAAKRIPADLDAQAALYRSLLAGRRMLIVLDNACDPAQVRPLLPGAPGCLVLVTSRNQLTGLAVADGAHLLTLDVLTEAKARQLLESRLGPRRASAEPAAVRELTGLCARLPLALSVVAGRAAARPDLPLAALAAELRGTRARLDALGTRDPATDVRTVFSWSCQQLSGPAAQMFRLLGVHPGPDITAAAAASLVGIPPSRARQELAELASAHLTTEHVPGRYASHDLLGAYAAEQIRIHDSGANRHAALYRVLDHYLHTAHTAALLREPAREPIALAAPAPGITPEELSSHQQALAWFEAEHHVLLAAIALAASAGFDTHAWQIPWAMATFLDGRGQWHEQDTIQRTALAAATRLGDKAGQAAVRRLLAHNCARRGDSSQARALLTECLTLYRQLGDPAGAARVHQSLSWVADTQNRSAEALSHDQQALVMFQELANLAGQAQARNAAGWHHARLGDYRMARRLCRQALALYRELGNSSGEAQTWHSLGYAAHHLGDRVQAIACYQRALHLFGELGIRLNEATTLTHLADTYDAAGDSRQARQARQRALEILDDLHHLDTLLIRAKLNGQQPASTTTNPARFHGRSASGQEYSRIMGSPVESSAPNSQV